MSDTVPCRRCDATITLAEGMAPTAHGLCHPCASTELDEVLEALEEAGIDTSRLTTIADGVKRLAARP